MFDESQRFEPYTTALNVLTVINNQMVDQALNLYRTVVTSNPDDRIIFYTVCDQVSWQNQQRLNSAFVANDLVTVRVLTPTVKLPQHVATSHRIPKTAYYRVLVDQLLANYPVHKILYLDVDIVNVSGLRPLFATDLGTHIIEAVADGGDLERFPKLNLDYVPPTRYFNSGVLLIDVDQWRQHDIGSQVLEYAQANAALCKYHDQDALNAILHSNWEQIHPRYNAQTNIMLGETKRFSKDILQRVLCHPVLVHFCGHLKPWQREFPHAFLQRMYYNASPVSY